MTASAGFPAPTEGFVITHFLVVSDQDRSREWYENVLGAQTVLERDPVIMQLANAAGATFLTEPKDHVQEIRAYMRDPDGHLIEVGQATGVLSRD